MLALQNSNVQKQMSTNVVSVKGEGGMGLSEIDNQRWWDTHNKFKEEQWISMCLIIITC